MIDDLKTLARIAGSELVIHDSNEDFDEEAFDAEKEADEAAALAEALAQAALEHPGDGFAGFVGSDGPRIHRLANVDERVAEALLAGYRLGISTGSGACMNDLGALYYMGDVVKQDYAKAAELYEQAVAHGCFQSVINLGYIYEYGRAGVRDLALAYRYYSLAAALAPSSEAVYKLGDMFSRGALGEPDPAQALALWERSLDLAEGLAEIAQPAVRIAQLLVGPDREAAGVEPNPLRALYLFQQAEVGLRIDIENGQTYYRKRLAEAIEGQQVARALLDGE